MLPNIRAGPQRPAIPVEVFNDIAAELEAVHDVRKIGGMVQPDRMTGLVQARQVHDRIAEQSVALPGSRDLGSELGEIGMHFNRGAPLAVQRKRSRIAVKLWAFAQPEPQAAPGCLLPSLQRPLRQFGIARLAAGTRRYVFRARLNPEAVDVRCRRRRA
jgi:hypothetical protein